MKLKLELAKLKIMALVLVMCVMITVVTGGSIAYFTDARQMNNVFTSGNVRVELTEAAVKDDGSGNLIEDTSADRIYGSAISDQRGGGTVNNYGVIFPGQSIFKDPTITNTSDRKAWVAAKVIISDGAGDINRIMGYPGYSEIDIETLLSGGLLDENIHVGSWNGMDDVCYNDNYSMVQIVADSVAGVYEFYFFILSPLEKNGSVTVFDNMTVPAEWGSDDMKELAQLNITIQAFAVQEHGFSDCYTAMREAFPAHFSICQ